MPISIEQRLKHYRVLVYPTESVYGLGCHPDDSIGLQAILDLKQRSDKKGFILIASDWEQVKHYTKPIPEACYQTVFSHWPGPYTWLFPCQDNVSPLLRGAYNSIAIRITAHPVASKLCQTLGHALVSTSANPAGYPPARDTETLLRYFPDLHPLQWISGALGGQIQPTQIQDALTGQIIRSAS